MLDKLAKLWQMPWVERGGGYPRAVCRSQRPSTTTNFDTKRPSHPTKVTTYIWVLSTFPPTSTYSLLSIV